MGLSASRFSYLWPSYVEEEMAILHHFMRRPGVWPHTALRRVIRRQSFASCRSHVEVANLHNNLFTPTEPAAGFGVPSARVDAE